MRRLLFLLLLLLLFSYNYAQVSPYQVGFGYGTTVYFGDLGNEKYVPLSEINQGISLTLRKQAGSYDDHFSGNYPFSFQLQATWHRIGYDETRPLIFGTKSGTDLRNFRRGLNFKNDLIGLNFQFSYTLYPMKNFALGDHHFGLYLFIGPGIFYSDPRADLFRGDISLSNRYYYWGDGTLRTAPEVSGAGDEISRDGHYETHLRDWYTEGQSAERVPGTKHEYSKLQVGFPHGGGIKFGITPDLTFQFEACFYDFITDYLDDVSGRYASSEEIAGNFENAEQQALAAYISDPSGWGTDGNPESIYTSRRGNPKKRDWINFMNVQLSFAINSKKISSYHGLKKKRGYSPKI